MPLVEDVISQLGKSTWFTALDLQSGFWQIRMAHEDLGHSGEQRLLAEIYRRYFWHCRTEDVKSVVRSCQQCQLVKSEGSI